MRLCLYNGSKKKKPLSKQSKKNNPQVTALSNENHNSGTVNKKKKCNNGSNNTAVNSKKTSSKSNKNKKKADVPVQVELAPDPPQLCSNLSVVSQIDNDIIAHGAREFWNFVDAYTSVINKEDINLLNHLTEKYNKENCPLLNIPLSNNTCSLNFPDNWVERIVGALVDPDLFPSGGEDMTAATAGDILSSAKTSMKQKEEDMEGGGEAKRMKLGPVGSGGETGNNFLLTGSGVSGVFSERSCNFLTGLPGSMFMDEEDDRWMEESNCDTMSTQDEPPDEVSREILKCQEELAILCRDNEATLSRLTTLAQREFDVQHLAQNLELCENELVKLTQQTLLQSSSSGHRLKKETATTSTSSSSSSSKKSRDEEILLLQRREFLLASIRDKED